MRSVWCHRPRSFGPSRVWSSSDDYYNSCGKTASGIVVLKQASPCGNFKFSFCTLIGRLAVGP